MESVSAAYPFSFERSKEWSAELARTIPLFETIWKADPKAELHGGTSFSYYLWFLSQFKDAKSEHDAETIFKNLKDLQATSPIDIRAFIWKDSDVDLLSAQHPFPVEALDFGVKKIDASPFDRYDVNTELGKSEFDQGYLPVEKMRLRQTGWNEDSTFGRGLAEVFSGEASIEFSSLDAFQSTHFAKKGINHPVLLVFRYLRRVSQIKTLHGAKDADSLPLASRETIKSLVAHTEESTLIPFLKNEAFLRWYRDGIWRGFRGYFINPSLTFALYQQFGLPQILKRYNESPPIQQIVLEKSWDTEQKNQNLLKYDAEPSRIFLPVEKIAKDRIVFHATPTEERFENILKLGFFESNREKLSAGTGIYTTVSRNTDWAVRHFGKGEKNRLIGIELSPNARFVDITQGQGKRLYDAFIAMHPKATYDTFCEHFGIDLLRYPYNVEAYVIKNTAIIKRTYGVHRKATSIGSLEEDALQIRDWADLADFAENLTRGVSPTTKQIIHFLSLIPKDSPLGPLLNQIRETRPGESMTDVASLFLFVAAQEYLYSIRNLSIPKLLPKIHAYIHLIERAEKLKPHGDKLASVLVAHAEAHQITRNDMLQWVGAQKFAVMVLNKRQKVDDEMSLWTKSSAAGLKDTYLDLIEPKQLLRIAAVAVPCLAMWIFDSTFEVNSNGAVARAITQAAMVSGGILMLKTFVSTLQNYLQRKASQTNRKQKKELDQSLAAWLQATSNTFKKNCSQLLLRQDLNSRKRSA